MLHAKNISLGKTLQIISLVMIKCFVFLFPFFFLPFTLDVLEVNKQSLFFFAASLSVLLWVISRLLERAFVFTMHKSYAICAMVFVAFGVSAWFSRAPFLSWVGYMNQEYTSVLTMFCGFMLFLFVSMVARGEAHTKSFLNWLVPGALVSGLIGMVSIFAKNLIPFFPSTDIPFNPIGSINTSTSFLVLVSFWSLARYVSAAQEYASWKGKLAQIPHILLYLTTLFYLLYADYRFLWLLVMSGCVLLCTFAIYQSKRFEKFYRVTSLFVLFLVSLFFLWLLPNPWPVKPPLEVGINFTSSFNITKQSVQHGFALFGTGPGTFVMNYDAYRSAGLNITDFWNTHFDRANSFFMTLPSTIGYVGTALYFLFIFSLGFSAIVYLLKEKNEQTWKHILVVFTPWTLSVVAIFLFPSNMSHTILFFLLSGALVSVFPLKLYTMPLKESKGTTLALGFAFLSFILILFIGIFLSAGRYLADVSFAKAIRADRTKADIQTIVRSLDRAATLNRFRDDYYRNLSQALLFRVQDETKNVDAKQNLTESSRLYIQSLVAASVNSAVQATRLSPNNVTNWMNRGSIYEELVQAVPNASRFAREAYEQATKLDPQNPSVWTKLGKIDLVMAEEQRSLTLAKDQSLSKTAKIDLADALNRAQASFEKAIELKANYAPAHYQLAITFDRQGKLGQAIQKMEAVFQYNPDDVGVGFQLGMLYLRRNTPEDVSRAQKVLEHVVELVPSYVNARWFLATVYEKQNKLDAAKIQVEKVLALDSKNTLVQSRLEKLKAGSASQSVPNPVDESK